jgi:hypothetical protein
MYSERKNLMEDQGEYMFRKLEETYNQQYLHNFFSEKVSEK